MTLHTPWALDGVDFGFEWFRVALETGLREGAVGANDFKVTAPAGGGMRVDIAAGLAAVKGDTGTPETGQGQGLYLVSNDASIANAVTLAAAHATLPRLDQIVLEVNDATDLGDASNSGVLGVVTGTATSGANLDANRSPSAAALPGNMLRLADVLIPAASSVVTAGNIRDRRTWANGTYGQTAYTSGLGTIGNTTVVVPGTTIRLELGAGQQLEVEAFSTVDPGTSQFFRTLVYDNGVNVGLVGVTSGATAPGSPPAGWGPGTGYARAVITSSGSHVLDMRLNNSAATGALSAANLVYRITNAPNGTNGTS